MSVEDSTSPMAYMYMLLFALASPRSGPWMNTDEAYGSGGNISATPSVLTANHRNRGPMTALFSWVYGMPGEPFLWPHTAWRPRGGPSHTG